MFSSNWLSTVRGCIVQSLPHQRLECTRITMTRKRPGLLLVPFTGRALPEPYGAQSR